MSSQPTMVSTQLEKKLERLFSRRKPDAPAHNYLPPSPTESIAEEPMFPSPSFIRPKGTRMIAREEVMVSSSRTHGALDGGPYVKHTSTGHCKTSSTSTTSSSVASAQTFPRLPRRSSSLCRRHDATLATLKEMQYQQFRSASFDKKLILSPSRYSPRLISRQSVATTTNSSASAAPPAQRLDTPPPSDGEEEPGNFVTRMKAQNAQENTFASASPKPSLDLFPIPRKSPNCTAWQEPLSETGRYSKYVDRTSWNSHPKVSLRKAVSTSSLVPGKRATLGEILDEPTFGDFLALSDEDIAEAGPMLPLSQNSNDGVKEPSGQFPGQASFMKIAVGPSDCSAAIPTRSASLSHKKSAAAAFEAARIASHYGFDLVYVVSLWPKESSTPSSPLSSHVSSCDSATSRENANACSFPGLNGCLLAAYGLGLIQSPFTISTAVHQKILCHEGWIEYRNTDISNDDFARGYACSFYASSGCEFWRGSASSMSLPKGSENDCGVVFAAYMKPRQESSTGCDAQELASLHKDAKSFVDMLLSSQPSAMSPTKVLKTYSPFPRAESVKKASKSHSRLPNAAKQPPPARQSRPSTAGTSAWFSRSRNPQQNTPVDLRLFFMIPWKFLCPWTCFNCFHQYMCQE